MISSGLIFVACLVSFVYFSHRMVRATRSRGIQRDIEQLREDRQLRRLSRRGK